MCNVDVNSDSVNYACDLKCWPKIQGHCNYDDVLKLENLVDGMKVCGKVGKPDDCDVRIVAFYSKLDWCQLTTLSPAWWCQVN